MTPAQELKHAAAAIGVRADCGPGSFWAAVSDWLGSFDGIDVSECGPMTDEITHALKIARAYVRALPPVT